MPKYALLFPIGERIEEGRFTLEERLDGAGYTYRAAQDDGSHCVMKFESKEERLAKLSERKILNHLQRCGTHPSVATEYEEGIHKDIPYFVRPYYEGVDLAEVVKRCGPLPPEVVSNFGVHICSGVDWIHRHNVVHCDLKPANILIPLSPSVRKCPLIIDFGYAVRKSNIWDLFSGLVKSFLNNRDDFCGTPYFVSPQVWKTGTHDVLSDVYAIGVTLFWCVTGVFPCQGSTAIQISKSHCDPRRPDPRDYRPDVPEKLARLINRAITYSGRARAQSANELGNGLLYCCQK